ncbi:hypothetical protein PR048_028217 [Dryococelus australis]|uniref:NADH dehydrogenase [ubiquinone] 1 alpha subcomplex subunit 2 n=1 Tax=Dryococelus australis TaxID=614101 RepID=A0ABQ9GIL8_9NEOP|nr:hypothetical protein PR048_028217 [Dryococelus australis]
MATTGCSAPVCPATAMHCADPDYSPATGRTLCPLVECTDLLWRRSRSRPDKMSNAKLHHRGSKLDPISDMAARASVKFGNKLKEIRLHLCQKSEASKGVRDFIEQYYVDLKKSNPKFPILIRECSGVQPKLPGNLDEVLYLYPGARHCMWNNAKLKWRADSFDSGSCADDQRWSELS